MPRLPYTAIRALLRNARKVAGKPSASSRRKLLEQIRAVEAQFQKVKPVEVPEGFPITRPTQLQARHTAAKSRIELYQRANLPEPYVKDIQPGIQGLSGKQLTPAQLEEFRNVKLPPIGGKISLARLEELLAPRVKAMNPSYAPPSKAQMTLRAGRRERIDYARKQVLGDPTFDPTTNRPKAGSASMFKGAQELGQSLEVRRNAAEGTAILMRELGGETRSVQDLVKMMMESVEKPLGSLPSRTGGLERTAPGQRMLRAVRIMREKQGSQFPRNPGQVSGSLDALLGPLRDISSAERGLRKEALAKLKARVLEMMGETYTGGAT
ncbi:hypothetical protein LCGC14_2736670 [marine sediment metagenome]|uniref:Uncharacterized protein n=1 Tax=marine sediment metagenome TaxID=412755 RepID=A0A0F8ZSW8_9ZZZZ